jgi:hypothetical protein
VSAPVTNSGFQAAMGGHLSTIGHTCAIRFSFG